MLSTDSMGLITVGVLGPWVQPEASTSTRSIAGGVHPSEQAKAVRQLAQQHRNDGAFWNRRYAAARS